MMHDGPNSTGLEEQVAQFDDPRVKLVITEERKKDEGGYFGHHLRALAIKEHVNKTNFIVHTNCDNYYVPGFCEIMLRAWNPGVYGIVCDCLHNYIKWDLMKVSLKRSKVDCGCLMIRASIAKKVGWPGRRHEADWDYLFACTRKHGPKILHVHKPLFIHN